MAKVYHADMRAKPSRGMLKKLQELAGKVRVKDLIERGDLVAVKTHFGEAGSTAFIPPMYVRTLVEEVRKAEGRPFVTDSNTLYVGGRANAVHHLRTAANNGFTMETLGAPIIIADGLRGHDFVEVPVEGGLVRSAKIAAAVHQADALVMMSHLTGHEYLGFGGAMKNASMGLSSRGGKQQMHSDTKPRVKRDRCTACARCVRWCPADAISIVSEGKEAFATIDRKKCVGCGECTVMCFEGAIAARLGGVLEDAQKKCVEYCMGALEGKEGKVAFFSFLMNVAPDCDCWNYSDDRVLPDIGILASRDIVSIEQAALDLLNEKAGKDLFGSIHPGVTVQDQVDYAEKMGLGSREYELVSLD